DGRKRQPPLLGGGRWNELAVVGGSLSRDASSRRQDHDHLAPFKASVLFDLGKFGGVVAYAVQKLGAELLVGHFAAAEPQCDLHLIAFLEEPLHRAHLHVVVVIVDHRTKLDFLDLDDFLLLARLGGLLLLLVLVLPVIEQLADRWTGVGRDLDQIKTGGLGGGQRFRNGHIAPVRAVFIDQVYYAGVNLLVDARAVFLDGRRGSHRAANGKA